MSQEFVYVVAAIIGVIASGRMTRLITHDSFPPAEWFRIRFVAATRNGKWSTLVECPWCAAPYIVAVNLAWALLSDLHWAWWVANGWLAASYAASWLVYHDED